MPRSKTAHAKKSSKPRSRARTIRSRRTPRTIVKPATPEQILREIGTTAAELRIIDRIIDQILPRTAASRRAKRR